MRIIYFCFLTFLAACGGSEYRDTNQPISSVSELDINRYLGKWYEVARYPNWFERDCAATTAEYSLLSPEELRVINTCRRGGVNGKVSQSKGRAKIIKPGQLNVTFAPIYIGSDPNYWILGLRSDYSVVVVGLPSGSTGWILARTPQISEADMDWGRNVLEENGYDLAELIMVPQPIE